MAKRIIKRNIEDTTPTLYSSFIEFIEGKKAKNLAPISIHDYQQSFQFFINHFNYTEATSLNIITAETFEKWTLSMLTTDLKPTSINRYLRDMRAFINWLYNKPNPYISTPIKITLVQGQEESIKSFSDDEISLIIKQPSNLHNFTEWRMWTIINWVLGTGCRCSTVCNIQIGDIDFRNKEISFRHTKNKKAQVIPLSPSLEVVIRDYIKTWRHNCTAEDWLFPNSANEKLSAEAVAHSFSKYCKDRGCNRTNIHGLRHSFALNWVRNGGNEFKLQKILGHSTLEMTRRYVNLATADLKEDFECFSTLDVMKKSKKPKKLISFYHN